MSNIYLVWIWDGYNDSCAQLQIIFAIEKEAIEYASIAYLPHKGVVYVTKEEIGVCCTPRYCKQDYVYKREHYDPQKALWEEIRWVTETYDEVKGDYVRIDKDTIIDYCIHNYSPMCVDINWDLLYKRYTEQYD